MKPRPNDPCPCGSGKKYKKCHGSPAHQDAVAVDRQREVSALLARAHRLQAENRLQQAEALVQQALQIDPASPDGWLALGNIAERAGDGAAAVQCYSRLLAARPGFAQGHFLLGNVLARMREFPKARQAYRTAASLRPDLPGLWNNLGNVEKYLGNFSEALACFVRGIDLEPDLAERARRHSNLLVALHFDERLSHQQMLQAHLDWAERYARPCYPADPVWRNGIDPERRLRVGYVSGAFNGQIVGHFIENVLAQHDRGLFHIALYSSTAALDAQSARLKGLADEWIELARMSDDEAARRIRGDQVDLLVDLDGHTPAGRPLLFARKPAPLQIAWLDYFDTTGMETMDAILSDPHTTPDDSPQRFVEQVYRLPHTRFCYAAPSYAPPVAAAPCAGGKPVTFGSFNRQDKLTPEVIALWAGILKSVAGSRLLLKNRGLDIPAVRDAVTERFARAGVDPARISLRGPSPHAAMLAEYAGIDIALDPFPYNGGLTSCECLWMGVPIIALEGERMISRQTSALLRLLGLADWIARTPAEYLRIAVEKSLDWRALGGTRAALRGRMQGSPLCDAAWFVRDLENAYRELWRNHCRRAGGGAAPAA